MKLNIKRILKKLGKANFTSLMFAVVSIISTTFAWFAFSNVVDSDMEINVRSWKIDISEGESQITNKLEIDLDEFYPGMETVYKKLTITNGGDIPSMVSYKINSLRIYDSEFEIDYQIGVFDSLAQNYPFSFNFNLDKTYLGVGDQVEFSYSISWPLDSGRDDLDALWGNKAYDFAVSEQNKKKQDSSYKVRDSISLEVELVVEQYVENEGVYKPDTNYKFGTSKFLNRYNQEICEEGSADCVKFTVVDKENSLNKDSVFMFADPNYDFPSNPYIVGYDGFYNAVNLLWLLSSDVVGTQIVIPGLSNRILGVSDDDGIYTELLEELWYNDGYIIFSKEKFPMFDTDSCYWVGGDFEYLAIKSLDDDTLQLYYETSKTCKIVPRISYSK